MTDQRPRAGSWALPAMVVAMLWLGAAAAAQEEPATTPPTGSPTNSAAEGDNGASPTLHERRPGTYDLRYRDTDLQAVLRLLSAQTRKNIITTKEVTGKVSADLYGVTFKEALEAVLKQTGYVYEEDGNFIYVYTPKQYQELRAATRSMTHRTFRLSYITATDAKTLIAPLLSETGTVAITPQAAQGISPSDTDTGGDSYATDDVLVVRDFAENLSQVELALRDLDRRPEQVLIEATILRCTLEEDNALGIDFSTLAGVDFSAYAGTTPGGTDLSLSPGTATAVSGLNSPAAAFRTDFNDSIKGGGLSIGLIMDKVAFFVRALEGVTDVTVLASPQLLVVNKQRGEVMIGNRDGYLTTTVTETVATQTVQFLETGTKLVVRPYIGTDGYIRMEIHPEDSTGGVELVGDSVLPFETTTEVTTQVLIRDGHTIVIGGLFRELTSNGRSQVPVLGNIPYLGTAFRSTIDKTKREEVIILLTPHIIRQAAAEGVGERTKDDVERFRIGQRKGLQWWSRSRLAQTHMQWAKRALQAGDRGKALWNIDMALSMSPRMQQAIDLRERLTNKAYWADQARISSGKYIVQKLLMQELGLPVERIIPPNKPRNVDEVDPRVREALGMQPQYQDPLPTPAGGAPTALEDLAPSADGQSQPTGRKD